MLLVSCVIVAISSAINLPSRHPHVPAQQNNTAFGVNAQESAASVAGSAISRNRTLTFADRVAYQRAIEKVYWGHRIWPAANAGAKPPLDRVMPQKAIEKKVEDYLRDSQALEDYWQRPITPDQLQADSADPDAAPIHAQSAEAVKMNSSEWQESVDKLAKEFDFGVERHVAAFDTSPPRVSPV